MGLCLAAGAVVVRLAFGTFTLAWTHSVERTAWEEDWRVEEARLVLLEARIKGSGAGMEPPEGAVLRDGFWRYRPELPPLRELRLARSGAVADWRLCAAGVCRPIGDYLPPAAREEDVTLAACGEAMP